MKTPAEIASWAAALFWEGAPCGSLEEERRRLEECVLLALAEERKAIVEGLMRRDEEILTFGAVISAIESRGAAGT
jgi:hypothetical protein